MTLVLREIFRRRLLPAVLASLLAARLCAAPQAWDLPAQGAAAALLAYAAQSGHQVLFSAHELQGVRSSAVQGEHEPRVALERLLAGTNLEAVFTGETRVVVRVRAWSRLGGTVLDGAGGAPLAGAVVSIAELKLTDSTGRNGRYQFARVPAGAFTVVVEAGGRPPVRVTGVVVESGRDLELKPIVVPASAAAAPRELNVAAPIAENRALVRMDELVVTPSRFGIADGPAAANAQLTHEDLERLPQLGEDLYRAIGRLPGLATIDYSAKFWVRGAPNEQVLARLDGLTLLEPYHIKDLDGALAIVDLETVSRLDLLSGGFTAEYGDRLAGVLEMETAAHQAARPRTTLGLSLTGVRATNRGAFAGGKGSWMVSGRMGYPDITIDAANPDPDGGGDIEIRYHDLFGKIDFSPAPGQVFAAHVLHSHDTLTQRENPGRNLDNSYGNNHVWLRWRADFPGELQGETVLAYSALDWRRSGVGEIAEFMPFEIDDDRDLRLAALRSDWSWTAGDRSLLRGGVELQHGSARYRYHRLRTDLVSRSGGLAFVPSVLNANPSAGGANHGGYLAWRFQPLARLTVEPGLRYDWSDYGPANGGASPRFNAAWDFGRATVRVAWGRYRQQQGLHEIAVMDGESAIGRAETAGQRVLGFETRLSDGVGFRAELYDRTSGNPRPHGDNLVEATDMLGELLGDRVWLQPTRNRARGAEFILESRGRRRLDWSASYALAKTAETIAGREVPRDRDQRHSFHADVSYRPDPRWQFTASWQYHSGWPTTEEFLTYATLPGGQGVQRRSFGPGNASRLPAYHRLDLRATRVFQLERGTLRAFIDIFNAYDQGNAASYVTTPAGNSAAAGLRRDPNELLPILPSAGLIWDF